MINCINCRFQLSTGVLQFYYCSITLVKNKHNPNNIIVKVSHSNIKKHWNHRCSLKAKINSQRNTNKFLQFFFFFWMQNSVGYKQSVANNTMDSWNHNTEQCDMRMWESNSSLSTSGRKDFRVRWLNAFLMHHQLIPTSTPSPKWIRTHTKEPERFCEFVRTRKPMKSKRSSLTALQEWKYCPIDKIVRSCKAIILQKEIVLTFLDISILYFSRLKFKYTAQ